MWRLKQRSNEKPCVQVMSLLFSALLPRSAASSSLLRGLWEGEWVSYGQDEVVQAGRIAAGKLLQQTFSSFWENASLAAAIAMFREASFPRALQCTEIRAGGGLQSKVCWVVKAGLAAYCCVFMER